jgi:hypothetical protein
MEAPLTVCLPRPGRFVFILSLFTLLVLFHSCSRKKIIAASPVYSQYIEGYTSGMISRTGNIRVQLSQQTAATHSVNEPVKKELFSLSPAVNGKAYWVDARTIEFKPDADLKPDQLYEVTFRLGKVTAVPDEYKTFRFSIQTIKPSFAVSEYGLKAAGNSKDKMILEGEVETADVEEGKQVEKVLAVALNNSALKINWAHNESNRLHKFTIEGITRSANAGELVLNWNGEPMNIKLSGNRKLEVPATGDFKVLQVRAIQEGGNYISVQFSDPLATNQDFAGLITVSGKAEPAFSVSGSEVKVFVSDQLDGNQTVNINEGIQNLWGNKLTKPSVASIFFENRLPYVKIQGKGVILPNSGKLVLPFEAINLNAVDVSVLRIYENNIPQFLQSNSLDGSDELRRVAKPVVRTTIRLDNALIMINHLT